MIARGSNSNEEEMKHPLMDTVDSASFTPTVDIEAPAPLEEKHFFDPNGTKQLREDERAVRGIVNQITPYKFNNPITWAAAGYTIFAATSSVSSAPYNATTLLNGQPFKGWLAPFPDLLAKIKTTIAGATFLPTAIFSGNSNWAKSNEILRGLPDTTWESIRRNAIPIAITTASAAVSFWVNYNAWESKDAWFHLESEEAEQVLLWVTSIGRFASSMGLNGAFIMWWFLTEWYGTKSCPEMHAFQRSDAKLKHLMSEDIDNYFTTMVESGLFDALYKINKNDNDIDASHKMRNLFNAYFNIVKERRKVSGEVKNESISMYEKAKNYGKKHWRKAAAYTLGFIASATYSRSAETIPLKAGIPYNTDPTTFEFYKFWGATAPFALPSVFANQIIAASSVTKVIASRLDVKNNKLECNIYFLSDSPSDDEVVNNNLYLYRGLDGEIWFATITAKGILRENITLDEFPDFNVLSSLLPNPLSQEEAEEEAEQIVLSEQSKAALFTLTSKKIHDYEKEPLSWSLAWSCLYEFCSKVFSFLTTIYFFGGYGLGQGGMAFEKPFPYDDEYKILAYFELIITTMTYLCIALMIRDTCIDTVKDGWNRDLLQQARDAENPQDFYDSLSNDQQEKLVRVMERYRLSANPEIIRYINYKEQSHLNSTLGSMLQRKLAWLDGLGDDTLFPAESTLPPSAPIQIPGATTAFDTAEQKTNDNNSPNLQEEDQAYSPVRIFTNGTPLLSTSPAKGEIDISNSYDPNKPEREIPLLSSTPPDTEVDRSLSKRSTDHSTASSRFFATGQKDSSSHHSTNKPLYKEPSHPDLLSPPLFFTTQQRIARSPGKPKPPSSARLFSTTPPLPSRMKPASDVPQGANALKRQRSMSTPQT